MLSRIERKASAYLRSAVATEAPTDSEIVTNRLTLKKRVFNMPLSVTDSGGGIAPAPDGGVLILDRMGNAFHHIDGQTNALNIATPDNGLDDLIRQHSEGALGDKSLRTRGFRFNDLLAIEREETVELFISYSDWVPEQLCYRSILSHVSLPGNVDVADWTVADSDWQPLKITDPCLPPLSVGGVAIQGIEAGGRLLPGAADEVLWSVGAYEHDDGFKETGIEPYAQREQSDYGRLFEINYLTGETTVLARGLRNPQGLTKSRDGRIWVTDHGMRGGDELNFIDTDQPEYNFGWPYVSYGTHYNGKPVDVSGRHAGHQGYDEPVVSFVPSVAPGAALHIEGFHPDWDGDTIVGAFLGTLERVHEVDGRAAYVEPISTGVRTRDMARTRSGEIVIWTDNLQLIFLTPSTVPSASDRIFASIDKLTGSSDRAAVTDIVNSCLQCHGLSDGEVLAGPSLHGICGERMGSAPEYEQYSEALTSIGQTWTSELLAQFIENPESVVSGTTMAWAGTQDGKAAAQVAELICSNAS